MRENIFKDYNDIYTVLVFLQTKTLELGQIHPADSHYPYKELIDHAHSRIREIQDKENRKKRQYLVDEEFGL